MSTKQQQQQIQKESFAHEKLWKITLEESQIMANHSKAIDRHINSLLPQAQKEVNPYQGLSTSAHQKVSNNNKFDNINSF